MDPLQVLTARLDSLESELDNQEHKLIRAAKEARAWVRDEVPLAVAEVDPLPYRAEPRERKRIYMREYMAKRRRAKGSHPAGTPVSEI